MPPSCDQDSAYPFWEAPFQVPAAQKQSKAAKSSPKPCIKPLFYWRLNGHLPNSPNRATVPYRPRQRPISASLQTSPRATLCAALWPSNPRNHKPFRQIPPVPRYSRFSAGYGVNTQCVDCSVTSIIAGRDTNSCSRTVIV